MVNFQDLLILAQNYGQSTNAQATAALVPEPGLLTMIGLAGAGGLKRQRRTRVTRPGS
jgi:hypothetical protein